MVWYLIVIPIVIAIVIKIVIPYIKKNQIDDQITCSVCRAKYNKKNTGCPKCGVGNR